ncbi:MAG: hypothetical protein R3301_03800 [Saprospiraceae bacterium]|nr:hypothetical protein [Saprospiraceae bacterium]
MKKVLIFNALIWAAVILSISFLFKDSPNWEFALGILVVAFTLQNGLTSQYLARNCRPKAV